jgi:hypothetical protein
MAQAEAVHYRYYPVHDIWLGVGWDSAPVGAQLQTLCTYFGLEGVATAPPVCHVRLTFRTRARPLALPRQACYVARQHGLHVWHADLQLYVQDGACVVRLDPTSRTGLGTLPSPQRQAPPAPRMDLLLYSVLLLLRYWGFYPEHAACVAHDSVGCLLVGDSGSGKSTLTLSLVQHGWHYLADDALLLRGGRDAVEAMAILASRLGCAALGYGHCQPTPDALAADLVLTARERRDVEAEIAVLQQMLTLPIVLAGDHYTASRFAQCSQLRMQEFNIDYRGSLTACCTLSNYRGGTPETDVLVDLRTVSFVEAHRRLIAKIAQLNLEKLARLATGAPTEAEQFLCTHCLLHYQKVPQLAHILVPPSHPAGVHAEEMPDART